MSTKPILGYWDIRGRAEPIRLLLKYANVDFVDQRYRFGSGDKKAEWFDVKFTLGLDFPNIPYLFDGDVKLSHSLAILQYLGRKYKLTGTNESENARIDLIEQHVGDLNDAFNAVIIKPIYPELKEEYLISLEAQLNQLEKFIGSANFVAGSITYVDFFLYEYLIKVKVFAPEFWLKFKRLCAYVDRIEQLPRIVDYIKNREAVVFKGPRYPWQGKY